MSKEELIKKTDDAISELVVKKADIQKAYNYYNGIRDARQFQYLKDNYGIGSPTSVEFTPLIKKHFDAIIGEFLGTPIVPKVSCKDKETISNITRDKQLYIVQEISKFLQSKLKNSILQFLGTGQITDGSIQEQLDKLKEDLDSNYTSEYEIAAQHVIEYIKQSRSTDFTTKLRNLLLDLLVTGYCIFRCKPSVGDNNVCLEVLDPRNTFIDRNPESIYIKDSYRVVIRTYMSKQQILNKYGRKLSKEDLKSIKENWKDKVKQSGSYYITGKPGDQVTPSIDSLDYGVEVQVGVPENDNRENYYQDELIPVYEVEWIEADDDFYMDRYSTIRISEDMYILDGKCENVIRTKDNPSYCGLSVNGIYFTNRSNKPYSLMLACVNLQDKYDLINYIRDNVIANSGSIGDYVDMSMIPTWLGSDNVERLQKFIAYKKNGIAPIDSVSEVRAMSGVGQSNTWMNGYDDTIKAQTIQGLQFALDGIEQTVCSITGVFKERLNGIEQHDAVTNVRQGAQNSFTITKQYYLQMDIVIAEMLQDALDVAKIVYKHGLTGTLILGDKYQKIFTALPEYFTTSDFDIHIITSTDIIKDQELLKQLLPEFLKSQMMPPEVIFEMLTSKSLTELKTKGTMAIKKQKEENNQLQQLQQQNQQLQQQLQQMQQQLQQAQQKVAQFDQQKMQIESYKIKQDAQLGWFQARTERDYKTQEAKIDEQKVQIEFGQLRDGNPYNDKLNFR